MKKTILFLAILFTVILIPSCTTCGGGKINDSEKTENKGPKPLNISVYLDLSDRLKKDLTPSQMERDTAIINHLVDIFIQDAQKNGNIVNSKNHFQVFFYPAPKSSQIAVLAKGLNVDLGKTEIKQKKVEIMEMKNRFQTNLTEIYNEALEANKFDGCDIWGFFSNKEVDKLCVRKGYRNILVILTDGFVYHKNNKVSSENSYSYILPEMLGKNDISLMVKRDGLDDLEVLVLEVNPYAPTQHDQLISILEEWFKGMGVKNVMVNETSLPVNTEVYIDNFFEVN